MSGKKEQKTDKMIDPHREFLDMDTDEEDFGRQESPEIEQEVPLEPEKPVFSEESLINLVNYVKDLTIFSSLDDTTWSENCDKIIREYFENPSHIVLSIFYKEKKLNAVLNIPTHALKGFTYFLRSPWQVYTPENFLNTVLFGSINENFGSCVLKFMENIYAPMVLHSDDYASFLRNEVFLNLHKLIIRLMDRIYKPMGLTTFYVPKERFQIFSESSSEINYFLLGDNQTTILSEEDERKRKLIDRLESVVWSWIKQIREVTRTSTRKEIQNIQDEVNHWNMNRLNLNHLRAQLLNPEVRFIVELLKTLRSPTVSKLEQLNTHIEEKLKETSSNLTYLNILHDFCKNLNVPEDSERSLTEALLLILFIWTESPFYSVADNIETLCRALSLQIIDQCKEYIELDVAFESNPEMGIQMLQKCIFSCEIYKTIYSNLTTNVVPRINPGKKWDLEEEKVFNRIDAFKQRCDNVIEICEALIVFGRYNKIGLIGSPKGTNYEAYCREIETLFYEGLDEIIIARNIIFDVTKSIWFRKIRQFRYTILQLENMVINLINDIFRDVKNIEEGIETIFALQKFKKRKSLRDVLQNKWIQVWKIFSNEVEHCYINAINEPKRNNEINIDMLCISQYLKSQYSIMINALYWIGECGVEKCILQQCEHVLDVIDERSKMFNIYNINGTQ